ncbi:MAG TPA: sigma-70 family RNA polymerase sigma factor [Actinomycetota bacterium]|nr:sigma-70 family RNA polymerase sigma factor [Actinomycetota bacterium]
MSPEKKRAFERSWPELERRLHAFLSNKNVPACKREDIVQETGLRLFGMWERVDPTRPTWRLAVTIALNLLRDEARRNGRREILGAVPEMATDYDVEEAGLARLELDRVRQALAKLSSVHRSVLLRELGDGAELNGRGANAIKMLRLRARRELNALLSRTECGVALVGTRIRERISEARSLVSDMLVRVGGDEANASTVGAMGLAVLAIPMSLLISGAILNPPTTPVPEAPPENFIVVASDPAKDLAAVNRIGAPAAAASNSSRPAATRVRERPYRFAIGGSYVEGAGEIKVFGLRIRVDKGGPSSDNPNEAQRRLCVGNCGIKVRARVCTQAEGQDRVCVRKTVEV